MTEEETLSIDSPNRKTFVSCPFQNPCWKDIRAPIARKNKIHLPYICSFQVEGDLHKCSHYWNYKEVEAAGSSADNGISTNGAIRDNL